MEKEVAECVGLWLAEGNNKCNNEITFTNNSFELIIHFDKILCSLFDAHNKRLYVYSPFNKKLDFDLSKFQNIKYYADIRARKPYFIWRVASVELMRQWKALVKRVLAQPAQSANVLRGFFAGEGSIKTGAHNNRTLRIAQKEEKDWINFALDSFGITYSFRPAERSYVITGKWNWDIFAKEKLAELHPLKKESFNKVYSEFKEAHYSKHFLLQNISSELSTPKPVFWLSQHYKRSQARISEVLGTLKKSQKVKNFRVGSVDYWVRTDVNCIVISSIKKKYIDALKTGPESTAHLAKVCSRSARATGKRLLELGRLGLVRNNNLNKWELMQTSQKIGVI